MLLQAFYEHQVKEMYSEFVLQILKPLTHDDLEHYRKFSLNILQTLLEKKPEMEDVILQIIVNKLGDQSKKVQCHTIYLLLKLSQAHLEMTEVIVNEVNTFISRATHNNSSKASPNQNSHVYYSVAYLNRIASMVAPKDEKVRVMLLRIYFSLFKKMLNSEELNGEGGEEGTAGVPATVKKDRSKSK